MRTMHIALMAALLVSGSEGAEEALKFASKPKVTVRKDAIQIEFEAGAYTDVAVEVVNSDGDTVRHLAAGRLGNRAPAPLKKDSLKQVLVWDRKDDLGKSVLPGKYTVRTGLQLKPRLEKLAGWNPLAFGGVRGVVARPGGGVILAGCYWPDTIKVLELDHDGKFDRQLYPPAADAPSEKSPGIKYFTRGDGRSIPMLGRTANPAFGNTRAFTCPMAVANGKLVYMPTGLNKPCVIDLKSGGFLKPIANTDFLGKKKGKIYVNSLALSPDGKWAYAAGIEANTYWEKKYGLESLHAVYRFPVDGSTPIQPWIGSPKKAGKGEEELNTPIGLATDSKGAVYVCDYKNDRVAIFSTEGKALRKILVKAPMFVQVHPTTGDLYIVAGGVFGYGMRCFPMKGSRLLKISAEGKELASMTLPAKRMPKLHWPHLSMALDVTKASTVVWLGLQPAGYESGGAIMRIEDKGSQFGKPKITLTDFNRYDPRYVNATAAPYPDYKQALKYKYLVEKGTPFFSLVPDEKNLWADGYAYKKHASSTEPKGLERFLPDGKTPLPYGETEKNMMPFDPIASGSPWFAWRGMAIDKRSHVYARFSYRTSDPGKDKAHTGSTFETGVHHYGSDGKKVGMIETSHSTYGLGVDPKGAIYIGDKPKPEGALVPEDIEKAFAGKVPREVVESYGAVFKYGPKGGRLGWKKGEAKGKAVRKNGDLFVPPYPPFDSGQIWSSKYTVEVKDAEWVHVGMSFIPHFKRCICSGTAMAVDGFGRTFLPDRFAQRVTVLDSNGNRVRWIGAYGNMNSRGKGSPVPDPDIAFANIKMVTQASSRELRVVDQQNAWVSVISLDYADEDKVSITLAP